MDQPKEYLDGISVIVPVYNAESYLSECIESILNQTYSSFELILINDGSKDSSGRICDEYANKDQRVRVFHKNNEGVSAARNMGIELARYKYLMFIDSDDYIASEMFHSLFIQAETTNADCIMTGIRFVFEKNGTQKEYALTNAEFSVPDEINKYYFMINSAFGFHSVWSKLYVTRILHMKQVRFARNLSILEDGSFVSLYLQNCKKCVCMESIFYNYRQSEKDSLMKKYNENAIYALEYKHEVDQYVVEKLDKNNKEKYYQDQFALLIAFCVQIYTRSFLENKQKKEVLIRYLNNNVTQLILSNLNLSGCSGKRLVIALIMRLRFVSLLHGMMLNHFQ